MGLTKLSKKKRIFVYLITASVSAVLVKLLWEYLQHKFLWWPRDWDTGEILAVIAIAFAVVQFLDARQEEHALDEQQDRLTRLTSGMTQQETRLKDLTTSMEQQTGNLKTIAGQMAGQAAELNSIAHSMSTRFAGSFPDNLETITSIINGARHSVRIMVDFPGYGQYSAPGSHRDYVNAIEAARGRGVDVQLMCYTQPLTAIERLQQFPDNGFATKNEQKFQEFFRFRNTPPVTCFKELRQILTDQDETTRRRLINMGVLLKYHHAPAAFFLWLIDEQADAVFGFKNLVGQRDIALSFKTQDGNLVRQLNDIFTRGWDDAKDDYHWTESTDQAEGGASLHAKAAAAASAAKSPKGTIH